MAERYVNVHGYMTRLECPACERLCRTIPPSGKSGHMPTWDHGDTGVCQCGASLHVVVDDDRAHLAEFTS